MLRAMNHRVLARGKRTTFEGLLIETTAACVLRRDRTQRFQWSRELGLRYRAPLMGDLPFPVIVGYLHSC